MRQVLGAVDELPNCSVLFPAGVNQASVYCRRPINPASLRSMTPSQGSFDLQRPSESKKVIDGEAEVS